MGNKYGNSWKQGLEALPFSLPPSSYLQLPLACLRTELSAKENGAHQGTTGWDGHTEWVGVGGPAMCH